MLIFEHFQKCTPEMYPWVPLCRFLNTPLMKTFHLSCNYQTANNVLVKIYLEDSYYSLGVR